ncbi:MAG: ribosomal protein S27E [Planctomycetota bacterium]|jgi:ribosomal protein S27E
MSKIHTICPGCKLKLSVNKSEAGASINCPQCSRFVIVPLGGECPKCGRDIPLGDAMCGMCHHRAGASRARKGRLKTALPGVVMMGIGLALFYSCMWRPLATGVQPMRTFPDITRQDDPFWFWLSLGVAGPMSALFVFLGACRASGKDD